MTVQEGPPSPSGDAARGGPTRVRAVVFAVTLVLAGEITLWAALPVNQGRHIVDDLLARLERPQPVRPAVIWSDSVTAGALESAGGDPAVADISSTQAVSLAGAMYTYRRLIAARGAPRVLVVCMVPDCFENDLHQVFTATYFESCFTRPGEILDFLRSTGRWAQAGRMAMYAALRPPSMVRRASVRRAIQELRSPGGARLARVPLARVVGLDPEVRSELRDRAEWRQFQFSEISRIYLFRLAEETARTGTRLVLVTGALPRSVHASWKASGYLESYERALDGICSRFPHVRREPSDQFADVTDEDMYDRLHLKPVPATAYGRRVLGRVLALLAE